MTNILSEYQIEKVAKMVRLIIWLTSKSDERGLTHGEKHHFHQVMLNTCNQLLRELGQHASVFPDSVDDIPNDIPF